MGNKNQINLAVEKPNPPKRKKLKSPLEKGNQVTLGEREYNHHLRRETKSHWGKRNQITLEAGKLRVEVWLIFVCLQYLIDSMEIVPAELILLQVPNKTTTYNSITSRFQIAIDVKTIIIVHVLNNKYDQLSYFLR